MIYGVIVAIAALYGVVLARRFGAPEVVDGDHLAPAGRRRRGGRVRRRLGCQRGDRRGAGMDRALLGAEPVLILVLYILMGKRDRIRGKAIGTALGVAAAIPVAILSPSCGGPRDGRGRRVRPRAHAGKTYWLMYGLYTFSLVLLLAAPGQVGFEAEERGFQILVGIGLLVVGLVIVHALGRWLTKRDPQPELALSP